MNETLLNAIRSQTEVIRLEDLQFRDLDLSKINLANASFVNCSFVECRFGDVENVAFYSCRFSSSSFAGSNLRRLQFWNVQFSIVDFSRCTVEAMCIHNGDVAEGNFTNLTCAKESDFTVTNSYFASCNMVGANLSGSHWHNVSIQQSDLRGIVLEKAHLDLIGIRQVKGLRQVGPVDLDGFETMLLAVQSTLSATSEPMVYGYGCRRGSTESPDTWRVSWETVGSLIWRCPDEITPLVEWLASK